MLSLSPTDRLARNRLNFGITEHLKKVKGLGKITLKHQLRQFDSALQATTTQNVYEDDDDIPDRDARIKALFMRKKSIQSKLKIRPGTLKSADERTKVIEASGRLVIPKQYYDRAVEVYDGSQIIIKELDLKETEEMQRQFKIIAERISPSRNKRLKIKSRVFSPVANAHRSVTPTHLESRFNGMLRLLEPFRGIEAILKRSATPRIRKISTL